MESSEPNGAVAVFATSSAANRALIALQGSGFDMRGVSVLGPGHPKDGTPAELDHGAKRSGEVARFWGSWGGVVGATVGGGAIAIPVIAAVVGLGPLAPVLAAVLFGATGVGAITSALVGYGVHETHALQYEHALRDGKSIIVAHTDDLGSLEDARAALATATPEQLDVHGLRALAQA